MGAFSYTDYIILMSAQPYVRSMNEMLHMFPMEPSIFDITFNIKNYLENRNVNTRQLNITPSNSYIVNKNNCVNSEN